MISIVGFVLCFIFLKETLNRDKIKEKNPNPESVDLKPNEPKENVELNEVTESTEELKQKEEETNEEIVAFSEEITNSEENEIQQEMLNPTEIKISLKQKFLNLTRFFTKQSMLSVALYGMIGLTQIMYGEVFPIYAWTPASNQGLGLAPYKIGILQGASGVFTILSQTFIIHRLIDYFGIVRSYQISSLLALPPLFGIVAIQRIAFFPNLEWLLWILIFIQITWRSIWTSMMFTSTILLVNNSVPKEDLGTLNGIAQSVVSLTRAIGPSVATPLFAFSISHGLPFPFDVHLIFYLTALLSMVFYPLTFFLKNKI
jgi:hypothetical protein